MSQKRTIGPSTLEHDPMPEYAKTVWSVDDILCLQPEWTEKQAKGWLERNEKYIAERLVELGWEVLETLIAMDGV